MLQATFPRHGLPPPQKRSAPRWPACCGAHGCLYRTKRTGWKLPSVPAWLLILIYFQESQTASSAMSLLSLFSNGGSIACLLSNWRYVDYRQNAASTELPPTPDMLSSISVNSRDQTPMYSQAVCSCVCSCVSRF